MTVLTIPLPLRFFLGILIQIASFAILCAFPFVRYFRYSIRKTAAITAAYILVAVLVYALASTYLCYLPLTGLQCTRISNSIVLCVLFPCFLWYLHAIRTGWQKKMFIFSFSLTSALFAASVSSCICHNLPGSVE